MSDAQSASLRQEVPDTYTDPTGRFANEFMARAHEHLRSSSTCDPSAITFEMTCHRAVEPFSNGTQIVVSQHGRCSYGQMSEVRFRARYSDSGSTGSLPDTPALIRLEDDTPAAYAHGPIFTATKDLPFGYTGVQSFTDVWQPLLYTGSAHHEPPQRVQPLISLGGGQQTKDSLVPATSAVGPVATHGTLDGPMQRSAADEKRYKDIASVLDTNYFSLALDHVFKR